MGRAKRCHRNEVAPIDLFDLFAKITIDTSDYEDGVKDATRSGDSLADQLKDGLSKAADKAEQSMDDASDAASGMSDGFTLAKGVLANFIADGIQTAIGAVGNLISSIWNLDDATAEYRQAMGRLNTAFETAGYSADTAQEAYRGFYGILGDTDTATEASQLLAQLADSAEDVSVWTDIAAGVSGTFGDSLPIESLIEAANETANVGTVTGTLADALNWVGISEDEFNERLAECSDESERNQLIMETLSDQYSDAADAFYENNEALVEARENQAAMDETLGNLGETISLLKNNLLNELSPALTGVVDAFNALLQGQDGSQEQFATSIQTLISTVAAQLPNLITAGTQLLGALVQGLIQAIPTLLAAVPQIVTSFITGLAQQFPMILDTGLQVLDQLTTGIETGLPDMVARIPEIITQFLNYITSQLPTILDKGVEILKNLIDGIINTVPEMVAALPEVITAFVNFISENLPSIVDAGIELLLSLIEGIISSIPDLVAELPKIIDAIVNGITSLLGDVVNVGRRIVEGVWQGISNAASWLWGKVKGFFSGIVDGVLGFLGIHSPSRVFADIGENMAAGVGVGWDNEYDNIRKDIEDGLDFGTANIDFASSSVGQSTRGINSALQNMTATMGQNFTITVQSVLDGKVIGETAYRYNRNKQRAMGVS